MCVLFYMFPFCVCHSMNVRVGTTCKISSRSTCGFRELNSGHQAWQQVASSTMCHIAVESLLSRIRERFAA